MPGFDNHSETAIFRSASGLPDHVVRHLLNDQRNSNIILPYILNQRKAASSTEHDVWVVSSTTQPNGAPVLNFVAALTKGSVDFLPLFIYHGRPLEELSPTFLQDRMEEMAQALFNDAHVPVERMFSVFAAEPVTRAFVYAWTKLTGVKEDAGDEDVSSEYYAALLTYCDKQSFKRRAMTVDPDRQYTIRRATMEDLAQVSTLCHDFAALSVSHVILFRYLVRSSNSDFRRHLLLQRRRQHLKRRNTSQKSSSGFSKSAHSRGDPASPQFVP